MLSEALALIKKLPGVVYCEALAERDGDATAFLIEAERGIVIASPPLEATAFEVEDIRWTYVFYESGVSINVIGEEISRPAGMMHAPYILVS